MESTNNNNAVEENKIVAEAKLEITEEMKGETMEENVEDPKLEEVKIDENRQENTCEKDLVQLEPTANSDVDSEIKVANPFKKIWKNVYKFVNYYTSCSVRKQNATNTPNDPK
jgi:hypothetical protein